MRAVAKAVNGINSRCARKMKDAIYLGCCVLLFCFFLPPFCACSKILCSQQCFVFSEAFSLFLFYVAATRVVALRGEGQGVRVVGRLGRREM